MNVTNITNTPSMGGILHFALSPQVTSWGTSNFITSELLRSDPQGTQTFTFTLDATTFGDVELTPRLTIAIPQHADSIEAKREAEKERRRKQEDFRRALGSLSSDGAGSATTTSAAAAVAAKESAAQTAAKGAANTTAFVQEKAVDEGWRSRWPDVCLEPYVIRAEEMICPLPMGEDEFSSIVWMRLHAADIVHYCVSECKLEGILGDNESGNLDFVDDRMCTFGVFSVSKKCWSGGKCFEGAYTFVSWFDNVFALKLFVFAKQNEAGKKKKEEGETKFYVRVELRASSERSLKILCGNKITKLLDTVFAGSAIKIDESNFHSLIQ